MTTTWVWTDSSGARLSRLSLWAWAGFVDRIRGTGGSNGRLTDCFVACLPCRIRLLTFIALRLGIPFFFLAAMCDALCSVGRPFLYPISSHLDRIITPHSLELFFLFAFLTLFCFFCFSFWVLYGVSPAFLYPGPNCRHTHSLIHYTQHTHSVFLHGSFFLYILYIIGDSICHNTRVWVGRSVGTVNFWLFIFLGLGGVGGHRMSVLSCLVCLSVLLHFDCAVSLVAEREGGDGDDCRRQEGEVDGQNINISANRYFRGERGHYVE